MGLETGTYISSLVATNPVAGDNKTEGDDHLRLIKATILATFPSITGAVTQTQATLNSLVPVRGFRATMNGGNNTTYTDTTLVFETEQYDTGSDYNNSTGVWVCPETGKYEVQAQLGHTNTLGTTTTSTVFVYVNTVATIGSINVLPTGISSTAFASGVLSLTASDFITIKTGTGGSGSASFYIIGQPFYSFFSVRRVG